MGSNGTRRAVETAKTALIVLLGALAVALAVFGGLFGRPLDSVLDPGGAHAVRTAERGSDALPRALAVVNREGCMGLQEDRAALERQYERLAPLLGETLSALDEPESITPGEWERALGRAPAVYFDYPGALPLRLLSAWLSGRENEALEDSARRLLLAGRGEEVVLCYQDEGTGQFRLCRARVTDLDRLTAAADAAVPNGAAFACQREEYAMLAPDVLILPQRPAPREFSSADPLPAGGGGRLERLLEALSFPTGITTVYDTPEGWKARSGNDMLTVSPGSAVTYRGAREDGRYPVLPAGGEGEMTAAVNGARRLALSAMELWLGQGQVYLAGVEPAGPESWTVRLGVMLDGIPVLDGAGTPAATLLVEQGYITQFDLRLRAYAETEQTSLLLPLPQAAAVVGAGERGVYLQLAYRDGGDAVRAGWIAEE